MKAYLELELFGEDTRAMCKMYTDIFNEVLPGMGDRAIGKMPASGWVAEITGIDPKFKYARSFLKRKIDYSRANSKGSRGVFAEYLLDSEKIYEVKSQLTWGRSERYFCMVDDDGTIRKIDESEVIKCLKSRSASTFMTPPETV